MSNNSSLPPPGPPPPRGPSNSRVAEEELWCQVVTAIITGGTVPHEDNLTPIVKAADKFVEEFCKRYR